MKNHILTELGAIRIGERGNKRPRSLDYFQIKDPVGNLMDKVHRVYGQNPKSLLVMLPYDEIEGNIVRMKAMYRPNEIITQCVGFKGKARVKWGEKFNSDHKAYKATCRKMGIEANGELPETMECQGNKCPLYAKGDCKDRAIANFIILDPNTKLPIPNIVGGAFKFRTGGFYSTMALIDGMLTIKGLTGGKLAGIPLELSVRERRVNTKPYPIKHVILRFAGNPEIIEPAYITLQKMLNNEEEMKYRFVLPFDNGEVDIQVLENDFDINEANEVDFIEEVNEDLPPEVVGIEVPKIPDNEVVRTIIPPSEEKFKEEESTQKPQESKMIIKETEHGMSLVPNKKPIITKTPDLPLPPKEKQEDKKEEVIKDEKEEIKEDIKEDIKELDEKPKKKRGRPKKKKETEEKIEEVNVDEIPSNLDELFGSTPDDEEFILENNNLDL